MDNSRFSFGLWAGIPALIQDANGPVIAKTGGCTNNAGTRWETPDSRPVYHGETDARGRARMMLDICSDNVEGWVFFDGLPADALNGDLLYQLQAAPDDQVVILVLDKQAIGAFYRRERYPRDEQAPIVFWASRPGLAEAAQRAERIALIRTWAGHARRRARFPETFIFPGDYVCILPSDPRHAEWELRYLGYDNVLYSAANQISRAQIERADSLEQARARAWDRPI